MSGENSPEKAKGSFWEWIFPIITALTGIAILYISQLLVAVGFVITKTDYKKYDGTFTSIYAILAIALLLILSYFSRLFYKDFKSGLLIKKPATSEVFLTMVIALGLLGVVTVYMLVVSLLAQRGGDSSVVASELEEYEANVDRYSEIESAVVPFFDKFLSYIGVSILVPIAEELLFRGVILGHLLKKYHPAFAIVASATIFGVMHGISIHIGYALISGIIIGCVYYFTSNIMMSTLMHMIFNFFGGTLSLILTDGWFSISDHATQQILGYVTTTEILAMTPATICFIILLSRKLAANKAQKEKEKSVEVVVE